MRYLFLSLLASCLFCSRATAQSSIHNWDETLDKMTLRERELVKELDGYTAIAETYIQEFAGGENPVTARDYYFLSLAKLGPRVDILPFKHTPQGKPVSHFVRSWLALLEYEPEGFVQMAHPNVEDFDRFHYHFNYVGSERLGDSDCLVFDVSPLVKSEGMYQGRIWMEERDYTIVRYEGDFLGGSDIRGHYLHFDSVRVKAGPLWFPATVFTEETDFPYNKIPLAGALGHARLKGQTRFWRYSPERVLAQEHQPSPQVQYVNAITQSSSRQGADYPLDHQAEDNILAKLENVGLLAARGPLEQEYDSIVQELETTNHLHIRWEVECRELLTTRLEFFTVGHTIIISRGLIEASPDKAVLAAVLGLGLARIQLDIPPIDTRYAFGDALQFDPEQTLNKMDFKTPPRYRKEVEETAAHFLAASPYRDSMCFVHEFFEEASNKSSKLAGLFTAILGDKLTFYPDFGQTKGGTDKIKHHAMPLDGRMKIDPWTSELEVLEKTHSPDGKPFEVMPLPY